MRPAHLRALWPVLLNCMSANFCVWETRPIAWARGNEQKRGPRRQALCDEDHRHERHGQEAEEHRRPFCIHHANNMNKSLSLSLSLFLSLHVYVCMYVCMYVYIYIYSYLSLSLYIYIYIYVYIYIYMYLSLYIYMYIYIYIYKSRCNSTCCIRTWTYAVLMLILIKHTQLY